MMAEGRLFFALWPTLEARERLYELAMRFKPQGGRLHHPDDLHMTLVFLGQVEDQQMPCIHRVADGIGVSAFTLGIDTIGHWPRPKILWCGPSEQPLVLQTLVNSLQQSLTECGFAPERRRYQPHVTLHRKVRHAESGVIENPIEWQAPEFVLASSGGGAPGQPRYRILHRWELN